MTPAIGSRWRHRKYWLTAEVLGIHGRMATIRIIETQHITRVTLVDGHLCGYEAVPEGKEGEG